MQSHEVLELELAAWMGLPEDSTVACSSGTAALHLALEALQLPLGSQVLVPDFAMIACARAVSLAGHIPIFVDCGDDFLLCPDQVDDACKNHDNVRAIMAVHTYGRCCDMEALTLLARKYDLLVVEDLAEAHGVPPHTDTDAACWSFYKNKIIAGEEGGAIAFGCGKERLDRVRLARSLRCLGFTADHNFHHLPRGHNYRLANTLAGLIRGSLADYPTNRQTRRWLEVLYQEGEKQLNAEGVTTIPLRQRDAVWVYDLRFPSITTDQQDTLITVLNELGVAARHGFKPLRTQLEYVKTPSRKSRTQNRTMWDAPDPAPARQNSDILAREVIYLPVVPGETTEEQIKTTYEVIREVFLRGPACPGSD